ncbi:MAG: hypothetical protein ACAI38_09470 [Myxococcota bacterium]
MPTDFEAAEREDRLASVSESGVSLVSKERLAELKAQLDEERHLLDQERAIQARNRENVDKERADLEEKAETLAIEAERIRERSRELDQRESAIRQRETSLARKSSETTNPRVDENVANQDWNLKTVAASRDEAQALLKRAEEWKSAPEPQRPSANYGPVKQLFHVNPVATFAFGFAAATIAMIILWSLL